MKLQHIVDQDLPTDCWPPFKVTADFKDHTVSLRESWDYHDEFLRLCGLPRPDKNRKNKYELKFTFLV